MLTDFMQMAIDQAKLAGVATYQNPQVGAVLVKDGHVICHTGTLFTLWEDAAV